VVAWPQLGQLADLQLVAGQPSMGWSSSASASPHRRQRNGRPPATALGAP